MLGAPTRRLVFKRQSYLGDAMSRTRGNKCPPPQSKF